MFRVSFLDYKAGSCRDATQPQAVAGARVFCYFPLGGSIPQHRTMYFDSEIVERFMRGFIAQASKCKKRPQEVMYYCKRFKLYEECEDKYRRLDPVKDCSERNILSCKMQNILREFEELLLAKTVPRMRKKDQDDEIDAI